MTPTGDNLVGVFLGPLCRSSPLLPFYLVRFTTDVVRVGGCIKSQARFRAKARLGMDEASTHGGLGASG